MFKLKKNLNHFLKTLNLSVSPPCGKTSNIHLTHRDNYMTFIMYYSTENIHINIMLVL